MEVSNPKSRNLISLRAARPDDDKIAISLIMLAARKMLVTIFGDGNENTTLGFLRTAWQIQQSQFGYGRHTIACYNEQPVGICTHWQSNMPEVFAKDTARAILNYYTLDAAKQVINRSQAATLTIAPPRNDELIVGHLAVFSEFQGKGLGAALINFVAECARQQDKRWLGLDVDKENTQAIGFYHHLGFENTTDDTADSPFLHYRRKIQIS
jgi:GNAT superfamily N-acetyltransferase